MTRPLPHPITYSRFVICQDQRGDDQTSAPDSHIQQVCHLSGPERGCPDLCPRQSHTAGLSSVRTREGMTRPLPQTVTYSRFVICQAQRGDAQTSAPDSHIQQVCHLSGPERGCPDLCPRQSHTAGLSSVRTREGMPRPLPHPVTYSRFVICQGQRGDDQTSAPPYNIQQVCHLSGPERG